MEYSTTCCGTEEKREVYEDKETPLATVMKEADGHLYKTKIILSSIITKLTDAPKMEENEEMANSFMNQVISANSLAYNCRCLAERIEQILFGKDTTSQG